jgi:hypothetical protein
MPWRHRIGAAQSRKTLVSKCHDRKAADMANRRVIDPTWLFPVAAVAGVVFSAIAISMAAGYAPESGPGTVPAAPWTETSTAPYQPPPPPIMMPDMGQVPCMGWTSNGQACGPQQ